MKKKLIRYSRVDGVDEENVIMFGDGKVSLSRNRISTSVNGTSVTTRTFSRPTYKRAAQLLMIQHCCGFCSVSGGQEG